MDPQEFEAGLRSLLAPQLAPDPAVADLRQSVLAVCVMDDVDLTPLHAGVLVETPRPDGAEGLLVDWFYVSAAVGDHDPLSAEGRARVSRLLALTRDLGARPLADIYAMVRPVGLPAEHALHPGVDWLREVPMGCALGLGIGLAGASGDPDVVDLPPPGLLETLGVDLEVAWLRCHNYLEDMGAIAAARLVRDPDAPLRPMGDCDVVTLLGSKTFRAALIAQDGVGVRAVAAPMRRRGWIDPDHVDAVFARTAAAATQDVDRGFVRPVLVTRDGVWDAVDGNYEHALDLAMREERAGENAPHRSDRYFRD